MATILIVDDLAADREFLLTVTPGVAIVRVPTARPRELPALTPTARTTVLSPQKVCVWSK